MRWPRSERIYLAERIGGASANGGAEIPLKTMETCGRTAMSSFRGPEIGGFDEIV
jgi:hypothetical protein